VLFGASALALALSYWICRSVIASKFGKVLVAIRDAESRTRFLGYRVDRYKVFIFTLSACMAGVAGALFVPQAGIINPGELHPLKSIEAVIWVAVGGRGTLVGPILGAILVNYAENRFTTGGLVQYWTLILGALFVLVTLFLPRGIVGTVIYGWNAWKARRASLDAEEGRDADLTDPEPIKLPGEPPPRPPAASSSHPAPGPIAPAAPPLSS
jgi:urea transport system permease protein